MSGGLEYPLPSIPYLTLKFNLPALQTARLPAFKGSLLRGAFGNALRRTVCVMGPKQPCAECFLNRQCVNTKLFETFIFEEPPRFLKGLTTAPKPFILDVPDEQRDYQPGEALEFSLTLAGKAVEQHPFVIFAVQRLAEGGLGAARAKFRLAQVHYQSAAGEWQLLFEGSSAKLLATPPPLIIGRDHSPPPVRNARIEFLSPTRVSFSRKDPFEERELGMEFDFRQLLFRMLRRTLELAYFYVPGEKIEWEFHFLLEAANHIRVAERNLAWKDLRRYSARQKTEMTLGGFVGNIVLEGDLTPFMAILRAAEVLHVGKATTFGLGKIRVIANG